MYVYVAAFDSYTDISQNFDIADGSSIRLVMLRMCVCVAGGLHVK